MLKKVDNNSFKEAEKFRPEKSIYSRILLNMSNLIVRQQ
jgi:hypothetical protein